MDEYKRLSMSVIDLAIEDIATKDPWSQTYQDADFFFHTEWFKLLATGQDIKSIKNSVEKIKNERALKWYGGLVGYERTVVNNKIAEISKTWGASAIKKIVWAWQGQTAPERKSPSAKTSCHEMS